MYKRINPNFHLLDFNCCKTEKIDLNKTPYFDGKEIYIEDKLSVAFSSTLNIVESLFEVQNLVFFPNYFASQTRSTGVWVNEKLK